MSELSIGEPSTSPRGLAVLPPVQLSNPSSVSGVIEHQLFPDQPETCQLEQILSRSVHAIAQHVSLDAAYLALLMAAYATDADSPWESTCILNGADLMQHLGWDHAHPLTWEQCQRLQTLITTLSQWSVAVIEIDSIRQEYQTIRVPLWGLGDFNVIGSLPTDELGIIPMPRVRILPHRLPEPQKIRVQVSPGSWISLFPSPIGGSTTAALCQYGDFAKSTLLISSAQHPFAARLAILLTATSGFVSSGQYQVQQLLSELIPGVMLSLNAFPERRLETIAQWDEALCILRQQGWDVGFDDQTYPEELRPAWSLPYSSFSTKAQRSEQWIQNWLQAKVTLRPTRLIHQQVKQMSQRYQSETHSLDASESDLSDPKKLAYIPGEILEKALFAKGISQSKFAEQLNLDRSMVNRWIKGSRVIQPKHQIKIWKLLGKELDPLMKSMQDNTKKSTE